MALSVSFNGPLRPRLFALACFLLLLYVGFTRSYYRDIASKAWRDHNFVKNPFKDHEVLSTPIPSIVEFPKKIWYKLGSKGQSPESKEWTATCAQSNPEWEANYLNDTASDEYVHRVFAERPDIVSTYDALSVPILKADMMRYLLLYSEGGLWNDLDVECGKTKIEDWIPKEFGSKEINLVVGGKVEPVNL
jgi:mannosyltransferase OCH1-like enzyme